MGRPRQVQICCSSKCLREIQPHEKAVALTCFAQTLGMGDRKSTRLNSSHIQKSRMPSSA